MTDSLIFSIVEIKLDITFATSIASRFTKNNGHQYIKSMKMILRYLKSMKECEIAYSEQSELLIKGYLDSN